MTKIGQTGYSFSEIIAEFVDNSIDARPEGQPVTVTIEVADDHVAIHDNARGMTEEALQDALTLAKSHKKNALGQYGIGLKAASVGLGNRFSVTTSNSDNGPQFHVEWDRDEWERRKDWSYEVDSQKNSIGRGTLVRVSKLNFKPGGKIGTLRIDLGRRFGPFLRRGEAKIIVNDEACSPPQMEWLAEKDLKVKNPHKFTLKLKDGVITGLVGLMKNSSQKGLYGFDTFRNGRMITYYDKIGFTPHPTVARVAGEVHMDHVPVTSNKREWVRTTPEYEEALEAIRKEIEPWLAECRRLSSKSTVLTSVEQNRMEQFKEGLLQAFNSEELKEYTAPERSLGSGPTNGAEADAKGPHVIDVAGREVRDPGTQHGTATATGKGLQRTPKKIDPNARRRLRVKGKTFDYRHEFGELGPEGPWMTYDWNEEKRHLLVITNLQSPVFHATKDTTLVAFLHVVESVAQVIMREAGTDWEKFDEIRQILVREASRHVAELQRTVPRR